VFFVKMEISFSNKGYFSEQDTLAAISGKNNLLWGDESAIFFAYSCRSICIFSKKMLFY